MAVTEAGQVLGGRWKPLHYMFEEYLYADVFITCGSQGQCYIRNDSPLNPLSQSTATLSFVNVETGLISVTRTVNVTLEVGPAAMQWFCAGHVAGTDACLPWSTLLAAAGCEDIGSNCYILAEIYNKSGALISANPYVLLAPPSILLSSLDISPDIIATLQNPPPSSGPIGLNITARTPALFVTLSTLAQGRFSRNAFFVPGGTSAPVQIFFIPFEEAGEIDSYTVLRNTLRILHL